MWVIHSDYYTPSGVIEVKNLFNELSTEAVVPFFIDKEQGYNFFNKVVGYDKISIAKNESEQEMVFNLIDQMFSKKICYPQEIDIVLTIQEENIENLGKEIQFQYSLNTKIINISGNQCANLDYAIYLGNQLYENAPDINKILIVGAIKHHSPDSRITNNFSLNGDGAGLLLLGNGESKIKYTKSYFSSFSPSIIESTVDLVDKMDIIFKKVSVENLSDADEKYIICTQSANTSVLLHSLHKQGFNMDAIYKSNLTRYGHLNYLDLIINLTDLLSEKKKCKAYMIGSSSNGTVCCTIFSIN